MTPPARRLRERLRGPLTPDDRRRLEGALVQLAQTGDDLARGALADYLAPRVAALARWRMRVPGAEVPDCLAAGQLGALDALRRFDPARGAPFWAYARHYARAGIVAERGHVLGLTPAQTRLWKPVRAVRRSLLDAGLPDDPGRVATAFRERHGRAVREAHVEAILGASARLVPLEPWHRPAGSGPDGEGP